MPKLSPLRKPHGKHKPSNSSRRQQSLSTYPHARSARDECFEPALSFWASYAPSNVSPAISRSKNKLSGNVA